MREKEVKWHKKTKDSKKDLTGSALDHFIVYSKCWETHNENRAWIINLAHGNEETPERHLGESATLP